MADVKRVSLKDTKPRLRLPVQGTLSAKGVVPPQYPLHAPQGHQEVVP